MAAADGAPKATLVVLDYEELMAAETSESLRQRIELAYGYDGLGILAVRGVPDFAERRAQCLPYAYRFASLPEEVKAKYVHEASTYSFGWSHGKEKLEGKPDTAKGSFYANPVHDRPFDDEETIRAHAPFAHPNIWPSEEDCSGFTAAFKALGGLMVDVGARLSAHVDAYVRSCDDTYTRDDAKGNGLEAIVRTHKVHKGRLLYYFPMPSSSPSDAPPDVSSWCGWHNDHGSLTALAPAMYFDAEGREVACPDPAAGLYIRSRRGETVRIAIPADYLAFQIGETAQVHSGGVLQATPHCVRAAHASGVSRGTFVVFMEPEWHARMTPPSGAVVDRILRGAKGELLPKGVPPLLARWTDASQTFGEFTDKTLASYY